MASASTTPSRKRSAAAAALDPPSVSIYIHSVNELMRPLSNDYVTPFCVLGRWYPTVTHYVESQKFVVATHSNHAADFSTLDKTGTPAAGPLAADAVAHSATLMKGPLTIEYETQVRRDRKTGKEVTRRVFRDFHASSIQLTDAMWRPHMKRVMSTALTAKFARSKWSRLLHLTGDRPLRYFEQDPDVWGVKSHMLTGRDQGQNLVGKLLQVIRAEQRGKEEKRKNKKLKRDELLVV